MNFCVNFLRVSGVPPHRLTTQTIADQGDDIEDTGADDLGVKTQENHPNTHR